MFSTHNVLLHITGRRISREDGKNLTQVLPLDLINGLRELSPEANLLRIKDLDIGNDYLRAIYLVGDTIVRGFAAQFLKSRLDSQAPARGATSPTQAAAILRELALLPIGSYEERLGFLQALREHNLVAPEETLQLWDQGKLSEIRFFSTEISREPVPSGLPDDLQELFEQSIEDLHANRVPQAEAALTAILARIPDHPIALGNLGAICARQGRTEECRSHLRQVIAVHPDYLFARVNLAALLIEDGELEEAKALLDGLMQRPRLYIQEYFALYGVLAMLSRARGDEKGAARLMRTLEQVVETKEEERLLAQAKARLEKVGAPGHLSPTVRNLMKNLESLMGRKNRYASGASGSPRRRHETGCLAAARGGSARWPDRPLFGWRPPLSAVWPFGKWQDHPRADLGQSVGAPRPPRELAGLVSGCRSRLALHGGSRRPLPCPLAGG